MVITKCENCGADLPSDTGRALVLEFPADAEMMDMLAIAGPDVGLCPVCFNPSFGVDRVVVCFLRQQEHLCIFYPASLGVASGEAILAEISKSGYAISKTSDPLEFRRQLTHLLAVRALPLINSFRILDLKSGVKAIEGWLETCGDQINSADLAAMSLISSKGAPIHVWGQYSEPGKPLPATLARRGLGQPADTIDLEQESALESLRQNVLFIQQLVILRLIDKLSQSLDFTDLVSRVDAVAFGPLLTSELLETLGTSAPDFSPPNMASGYAFHAVLAALFLKKHLHNPHVTTWSRLFGMAELLASGNRGFAIQTVSNEFAKQTVSARDLWDLYASSRNQVGTLEHDPRWQTIFEKAGAAQEFERWLVERTFVDASGLSEDDRKELLLDLEEKVVLHPGGFFVLQQILSNSPLEDLIASGRRVISGLLTKGNLPDAIFILKELTQHLNLNGMPGKSLIEIEHFEIEQKESSLPLESSAQSQVMLLVEKANTLRYLGKRALAIETYQEAVRIQGDDLGSLNVRTLRRNLAIVMRESGAVTEAKSILEWILPHSKRSLDRFQILDSLAICYGLVGERERAAQIYEEAFEEFQSREPHSSDEITLWRNRAMTLLVLGNDEKAAELAKAAAKEAGRLGLTIPRIMALSIWARASRKKKSGLDSEQLELLEEAIGVLRDQKLAVQVAGLLRATVAEMLEAAGREEEAESEYRKAIRELEDDPSHQLWGIQWNFALMIGRMGRRRDFMTLAFAAMRSAIRAAEATDPNGDPFGMMQSRESFQESILGEAVKEFEMQRISSTQMREAADFQSSVVLATRLGSTTSNLDEAELARLGNHGPVCVLQFARAKGKIHLILTKVSETDVVTMLPKLDLSYELAASAIDQVTLRLAVQVPHVNADPLGKVSNWSRIQAPIFDSIEHHVPPATPLYIIPGPLTGLPFQLALGDRNPIVVAPGLRALLALRARSERAEPVALPRFTDVSVWRNSDDAGVFTDGYIAFEQIARSSGVSVRLVNGILGTGPALLAEIENCTIMRIACHGYVVPARGVFGFLVSARGQLPPSRIEIIIDSADDFFLDWSEIGKLDGCAPLIFSCACSSGSSTSIRGGERIGLERPFFQAGCLTFVAPQWPVPIVTVQQLINDVIASYVANPKELMCQHVHRCCNLAVEKGVPEWIARSIVVYGNG